MMTGLSYQQNTLHLDNISLLDVIEQYGSPCYVYSKNTIQQQLNSLQTAFESIPHRLFYAVKANHNLAILNHFSTQQVGFDVVSIGELKRALAAGAPADHIIFSGVGKTDEELRFAITQSIHCINVESTQELKRIILLADEYQKRVKIAIRINPNIDANTHAGISTGRVDNKFGIIETELNALIPLLKNPAIHCIGIACHIGSQITTVAPFKNAAEKMMNIATSLQQQGIPLTHLDLGGGMGIACGDKPPINLNEYATAIISTIKSLNLTLYLEPGRFLVGSAGCLITQVLYTKTHGEHHFAVLDAGMNDFMRPALYGAYHETYSLHEKHTEKTAYDLVGPVCESTDCFAKNVLLPTLQPGDYLVFDSVGAYGSSMSSHYNARPLIPEILLTDNKPMLIRKREIIEETFHLDIIPR